MSKLSVSQINNATNERIYDRNIPSSELQPYFSLRPTSTKRTHMMTTIAEPSNNVPIKEYPSYCPGSTFYPGTASAPWSGFSNKIDTNSDLNNRFYALQKCDQATYVPHSNSDLYSLQSFTLPDKRNVQTHKMLF